MLHGYVILVISLSLVHLTVAQWSPTTFQLSKDGTWERSVPGTTPVCVDIPTNMSLCQGIGYTKMRLPNLLHHDSLDEVSQQALSWINLINLKCHPDTQLFLCSLFTPVCLDHPIPPCRSLCLVVKDSCEPSMVKYGYPWPPLVDCDQYPVDNDMCIQALHSKFGEPRPRQHHNRNSGGQRWPSASGGPEGHSGTSRKTKIGEKHTEGDGETSSVLELARPGHDNQNGHQRRNKKKVFRDILSKFCQSQWSLKARGSLESGDNSSSVLKLRNYRVLHGIFPRSRHAVIRIPSDVGQLQDFTSGAEEANGQLANVKRTRKRYYIMGLTNNGINEATYAILWPHKMSQFRKALKMVKSKSFQCETQGKQSRDPTAVDLVPGSDGEFKFHSKKTRMDVRRRRKEQRQIQRKQRKERRQQRKLRRQVDKQQRRGQSPKLVPSNLS